MKSLAKLIIQAIAITVSAYIVPGIAVHDFLTAVVVAALLAIFNILVKPILLILTLPVTILTLGLFVFVINAVIVMLISAFVPGFTVVSLWSGLIFSIVLTIVNTLLNWATR